MMRMGMVSTAHEQFKKLRMWSEAVDCLMIAERNIEATDMVQELIDEKPTPRLWCCLGDLENEMKHYETAWELSKHRFARAQRSMARIHFKKGRLAEAVDSFRAALAINPLHAEVWFTMGVAEMQLERFENGVTTFARCVVSMMITPKLGRTWLRATRGWANSIRPAHACMKRQSELEIAGKCLTASLAFASSSATSKVVSRACAASSS
jgi:tetratricopeptide (TPR) repeat protein